MSKTKIKKALFLFSKNTHSLITRFISYQKIISCPQRASFTKSLSEAVAQASFIKNCPGNILKINRKAPAMEYIFNKIERCKIPNN